MQEFLTKPRFRRKQSKFNDFFKIIDNVYSVVPESSSPKWDSTCEFNYFLENGQEGNLVSISIYDADPLGSDELLATQYIYLPYFKQKRPVERVVDFWLKLDPVNFAASEEQFVTDASIYQDLNLGEFEDAVIKDPAVLKDDSNIKTFIVG